MPLYEYYCDICGTVTEDLRPIEERNNVCICGNCGFVAVKMMSTPNLVTDTNFGYTGKVDKRLGTKPIEGRADWNRRVKEKNYAPLSQHDLKEL